MGLCMCVYVRLRYVVVVCMSVRVYVSGCVSVRQCAYVAKRLCPQAQLGVGACSYFRVCLIVCMYVCACVCMYVYTW